MIEKVKQVIDSFSRIDHVDQTMVKRFHERVDSDNRLTKYDGHAEHICSFFLPVHMPSRSIYLGHHKKANDWIPPGGHIDKGELPVHAALREFKEELDYDIEPVSIQAFDLSVKPINRPENGCVTHYDFWHLVYMDDKHDFAYETKEFHSAGWFELDKGLGKINHNPDYKKIISKLARMF